MAWWHMAFWVMLTSVALFTPKGALSVPCKPELQSEWRLPQGSPGFPPGRKVVRGISGAQEAEARLSSLVTHCLIKSVNYLQ